MNGLLGEKLNVQVTASASSLCGADQLSLAKLKSLSLDLDNVPTATDVGQISRLKRSGRSGLTSFSTDIHVIVVWLESYEDHLSFPLGMYVSLLFIYPYLRCEVLTFFTLSKF